MAQRDYSLEYGTALYELAKECKTSKEVLSDFRDVCRAVDENRFFIRVLSNPVLSAKERADTVEKVFGADIDGNLLSFLKILAEKRRFSIIDGCLKVYEKLYCEDNGILAVKVTSAVKLSDEQVKNLTEKLSGKTGKEILITLKIDPSYIGGICLEYGGKRYDASVRGKLLQLGRSIKNSD